MNVTTLSFSSSANIHQATMPLCARTMLSVRLSDMVPALWESQFSSHRARLWLFFPADHDSTLPNLPCTLVPKSRLPASLPKVLRSLFLFSWVGGKVSNPLLPKLPKLLSATLGIPFFSMGADEHLPFLNLTSLGTSPSVAYSPPVAPKPVWKTWELGVPWAYTGLVAASAAPGRWWAACADWYLGLDTAGKGHTPWMRSFMALVQGSYFFLQKWRSNVNFHGLFIARPYREKEKKWLKGDFAKYFVFKSSHCVGKKEREKSLSSLFLSRLPNKEGSVPQIQIVRLLPADKKNEFWGQLQINPFEQKYIVGGRWLYLARVSMSIINSYCYAVVISRFTAASGFMRFQFYVNDLEKWENSAVLFLMTAPVLWVFSILCRIPLMSPASQKKGEWPRVILIASRSINFF